MTLSGLKLTPKIAGSILVALTLTSATGFFISQRRINSQAEAAKACDELSSLALDLEKTVSKFTLRVSRRSKFTEHPPFMLRAQLLDAKKRRQTDRSTGSITFSSAISAHFPSATSAVKIA